MKNLKIKDISLFLLLCLSLLPALVIAETKTKKHEKKLEIPSDQSLGFFVASRDETLSTVKRIGILPINVPEPFASRDDLKLTIEASIAKKLSDAGYGVATHEAYTTAFDKLNRKLGGIYDPDTGAYKAEQAQAIREAARRDFIENEHLNGLLIVSVRVEKAQFYSSNAYLNGGVVECSLGKMPPSGVAEFFSGNPNLTGTLTSYSLVIQLTNTQDKIIYGRIAGIQLANYFDPQSTKGVSGFLTVPVDQALRDNLRIERAVAITTLPLVKTPEQIAQNADNKTLNPELIKAEDLPPPPQGIARKEDSPLLTPRDDIFANTKKIILLPINTQKITAAPEVKERFLALIEKELANPAWEVVRGPNIFESIYKEIDNTKGLFDPLTGKYDDARIVAIRKRTLESLHLDPSTAVLYPSIARTQANYKDDNAFWHGASQNRYSLKPIKKEGIFGPPPTNAEGTIAASTLFTQLRDSNDKIIYQGAGGIELIEQQKGDKASELAATELFQIAERESPAVHNALRNLLLTKEELDAELHPNRQKTSHKNDKKRKNDKEDKPEAKKE